jgi:hypothetical protein
MKSILAITLFIATLSLCNLADKSKPETNSAPPNTNTAQKPEIERVALTVELMRLEHELTTASFNGDISTLASFMADDYVGTNADGSTQNKNQVLAATKPYKMTKNWKITDGEVISATEDTAVLNYVQEQTLKNGQTFRARVTDTFVKRNGRWVVKSEQQTLMK